MDIQASPLVSIVIPTYNHADFLKVALQSVVDQTYPNWEAIVVDNHSQDDTLEVINGFVDSRIRVIQIHNNGVIAASRNAGIAAAAGEFVAFLDSDDAWYPEKLTKCVNYFNGGVGLVSHGLRWIGVREKDMFSGPSEAATFDALIDRGNCITPSATVVRKSWLDRVGGFSEDNEIVTSEDYHLWIRLAKAGIKMGFIREVLGVYRIHPGNQSGSVLRHLDSVLRVVDEFVPQNNGSDWRERLRHTRRYSWAYYGAGRAMQHNRRYAESVMLIFRAFTYWPFNLRIYVAALIAVFGIFRTSLR